MRTWCTLRSDGPLYLPVVPLIVIRRDPPTRALAQAIGCSKQLDCICDECVAGEEDSDFKQQAGIYTLSASQNLIENHVFGTQAKDDCHQLWLLALHS